MTTSTDIRRIVSLESIQGFQVYCTFDNGEARVIDFARLFETWQYKEDAFRSALLDEAVFQGLELENGTLCWPGLLHCTVLSNGMVFEVPFDLDPLVLYEKSLPSPAPARASI